jgi:hypothetical protein
MRVQCERTPQNPWFFVATAGTILEISMKLALAQIRIEGGKTGANRERAATAVRDARAEGCDLVCLPEMFSVGYFSFENYPRAAEPLDGPTIAELEDLAAEEGIAVLAGSIVEDLEASAERGFEVPEAEGYANTSVYIDAAGQRRGVYRKRHLFGYESAERQLLTPGESLATVETAGFTVGMTTCYDLRFPELYRPSSTAASRWCWSRARGPTPASNTGGCCPAPARSRTSCTSRRPTVSASSRRPRCSVAPRCTTRGGPPSRPRANGRRW